MRSYNFYLACKPAEAGRDSDAVVDALFEAGCDDALVIEKPGLFLLEFDREAPTFAKAFFSALENVFHAGMVPVRVGPDPLVSASEIAERAKISRQSVSLYVMGKRGKDFPAPAARLETDSPLWQWSAIARWLFASGKAEAWQVTLARQVELANQRAIPAWQAARFGPELRVR